MPFKKLISPLLEALERIGFEEPLPFQKQMISNIKSGKNLFCIAPAGSGKTTAAIIGVVQKLKGEEFEDAPRALIIVKDKEAAETLEAEIKEVTKYMSLRTFAAHEAPNIEDQKEEIYGGMDIVIATPKRLTKLFSITGINLNKIQLCIVEDAEFLINTPLYNSVVRISQSIPKTQYLVLAEKQNPKIMRLRGNFMEISEVISTK